MEIPTWVNTCLDERDGQIDIAKLETLKSESLALVDTLRSFERLCKAQFSMVMILVGLPLVILICVGCLSICNCNGERCKEIPEQGKKFLWYYFIIN